MLGMAPNGKIYGIPYSSSSVLIIDPLTNTVDTTTITGLSGSAKWIGGVLAPNDYFGLGVLRGLRVRVLGVLLEDVRFLGLLREGIGRFFIL